MYSKYEKYIDTGVDGIIFDIEHNLKTMEPIVSLFEPIGLTDYRSVSLYDSRISSIESKGQNISRVSFNASFQGKISFVNITNDRLDMESRIAKLETTLSSAIQQQKSLVTIPQWREMNNLEESQIKSLSNSIDSIQSQIILLKKEIEDL
jgi:hypothetical protein